MRHSVQIGFFMKLLMSILFLFFLPAAYADNMNPSSMTNEELTEEINKLKNLKQNINEDLAPRLTEIAGRLYNDQLYKGQRDQSEALELYEQAAKYGSIEAMYKLTSFYELGIETTVDKGRAVEFYEKILKETSRRDLKNSTEGSTLILTLIQLFNMHEIGQYTSKTLMTNGLSLYKKAQTAMRNQNIVALLEKAETDVNALLELTDTVGVTDDIARFLLMKAVEKGSASAMIKLADSYLYMHDLILMDEKTQSRKALKLYKQAFKKEKSAEAALSLAQFYHNLGDVIFTNPSKAVRFYTRAADMGSIKANEELALIYKKGLLGVKPNPKKAELYHQKTISLIDSQVNSSIRAVAAGCRGNF